MQNASLGPDEMSCPAIPDLSAIPALTVTATVPLESRHHPPFFDSES